MDEVAHALGIDPVELRLRHLKDPRDVAVVKAAAEKAGWQPRSGPRRDQTGNTATGRGIAYSQRNGSTVAIVAEVDIDRSSGRIWARKFTVAHDCGQIINPDGLRNQLEGNVIQTVSRTLKEELKFDRSAVTSLDWASYPILTFPEIPEVVMDLIDRPTSPPWGAGEPAAAVVPSAISNAVFDATGVRLRSVPYTPDKVKAATRGA
jgi:CO/xanthine dehydrogenase Mo-binding subunit